jgi:2-polyprenyl-6-methoxyphenol hydroxylase-like FAD-dependent oxidoreductase
VTATPLDVLVVGAGPTGLVLAAELRLHGAEVRLVEARRDRLDQSRAIAVQPRTLELFDRRGLAGELVSRGGAIDRVVRHARHFPPARIDLDTGARDTRFRGILFVAQNETEEILERHLEALGGGVERETTLTALHQDGDHITATLRHAHGDEEEVRTRYLVGADGAGSTVRHMLGIPFRGRSYQQSFVLADLSIDGPLARRALNVFLSPTGAGAVFFMPLRRPAPWRVFTVELHAVPEDAPPPTLADVQRTVAAFTELPLRLHDPVWINRFRIHLRMAARFRAGRVFLAGDAAHVHSPAGGQGMNTGIGDAWNLAWKLALVARGRAREDLLASYEAERVPAARFVLANTDRAFSAFVSPNPLIRILGRWLIPIATAVTGRLPGLSRRAALTFSQLGIAYPDSPAIAGTADAPGPRPGQRLPDAELPDGGWLHERLTGPGHHLVVCGPVDDDRLARLAREQRDLVTIHRLPAGTLGGGLILVRPDFHVAFRGGADLAPLEAYLARWLRPAAVPRGEGALPHRDRRESVPS